jgi:hypothetical protein
MGNVHTCGPNEVIVVSGLSSLLFGVSTICIIHDMLLTQSENIYEHTEAIYRDLFRPQKHRVYKTKCCTHTYSSLLRNRSMKRRRNRFVPLL